MKSNDYNICVLYVLDTHLPITRREAKEIWPSQCNQRYRASVRSNDLKRE